ncbi:hypothetical protein JZ751_028595 [Albula glossodonta]|uniref:Uncharacterized protein n=1 Tax=Albula glossodonta TaxID=121402 RepID=A0A8T2NB54_9TELE|nr:hypothetical protein JZ751_028595 [Albula glossodonta]
MLRTASLSFPASFFLIFLIAPHLLPDQDCALVLHCVKGHRLEAPHCCFMCHSHNPLGSRDDHISFFSGRVSAARSNAEHNMAAALRRVTPPLAAGGISQGGASAWCRNAATQAELSALDPFLARAGDPPGRAASLLSRGWQRGRGSGTGLRLPRRSQRRGDLGGPPTRPGLLRRGEEGVGEDPGGRARPPAPQPGPANVFLIRGNTNNTFIKEGPSSKGTQLTKALPALTAEVPQRLARSHMLEDGMGGGMGLRGGDGIGNSALEQMLVPARQDESLKIVFVRVSAVIRGEEQVRDTKEFLQLASSRKIRGGAHLRLRCSLQGFIH